MRTRLIEFNGKELPLGVVASQIGVTSECLRYRLVKFSDPKDIFAKGKLAYRVNKDERSGTNNSFFKHGKTGSRAWQSWRDMIRRCTDPRRQNYRYYGGRGIKICERWMTFENFHTDMGEPPLGYTLDRENNNRGYFKRNCRWASKKEQANNRRPRGTC